MANKEWEEFNALFSFENLYKAHMVARRCKRHKRDVVMFELNLGANLIQLQDELITNKYVMSRYKHFYVYEPKKREIQACSYRDRVVLHCLCDNYFTPRADSKLVYDNAACRKGRGVDFAVKRVVSHYREYYNNNDIEQGYCIRLDVSKYFASIDKHKLMEKVKRIVDNKYIIMLIERMIMNYDKPGLPIGNQISQIMAVMYLNDVDRYIKEELRVRHYVRYMDDFLLIVSGKENAIDIMRKVCDRIRSENLSINPKSQIDKLTNSITFIGSNFRYNKDGGVIVTMNSYKKKKLLRKVKFIHKEFINSRMEVRAYENRVASYKGLVKRNNSRGVYPKLFIKTDKFVTRDKLDIVDSISLQELESD